VDIKQPSKSSTDPILPSSRRPGFMSRINIRRSLRRHAFTATLVTLSILALGAALLLRHGAYYEATSVVYVSPTFPATLASDHEQDYPYESYIEQQAHSIARYDVLAEALHKLRPGTWQKPGEGEEEAIQRLQKRLDIKRDGLTYQVDITLGGYEPQHLAEIVNTITNIFLDRVKEDEFYGRDARLMALRQARAAVQTELDERLREQAMLSQQLGVAVIGGENSDHVDTEVGNLNKELAAARTARIEAEANLSSLQGDNPNRPSKALDAAADEIIASDPSLLALKTSLSEKRLQLLNQLAGLTPNHPLRKATEEQLADIEDGLQQMQTRLRGQAAAKLEQKLRTEVKRSQTVEAQLTADLRADTQQASTAATSFQRATVLKTEIAALQARYATLDERTRNLELESSSPGSVHMFSPARQPTIPVPSKVKKAAPMLIPAALLAGMLAAVLIDVFDPRLYSATDMERILGFSPIGVIFDDREVAMQVFDECTLRLAAGVDQASRTGKVRTVVLTAVNPGAGTTSIVENLGSTLAKLGRKTLAIDASGTKPPVAYITVSLNRTTTTAHGLHRVDAASSFRSEAVVAESLAPKLPSLNSFMDQAFRDVTNEYDIVLIDATPIAISAETEYLARFADVTILVAEAGRTKTAELLNCVSLLERLQVDGIAAIINRVSLQRAGKVAQEHVRLFETRVNAENLSWKPIYNQTDTASEAAFSHSEQPVVAQDSSYA
jgi:succinoglycan biosynthesis transport protein ExoP